MPKATGNEPLPPSPKWNLDLEPGKVNHDDVEHRQRQDDKEHGDRQMNHGDALIVPNVLAVRTTTRPNPPYTAAIAAP